MGPRTINIAFLALIVGVPVGQAAWELSRGEAVQALEVFGPLESERLRSFEDDLRRASFVHEHVTPWYQRFLLSTLRRGNEKAFVGLDGTVHYTEDLAYLASPDAEGPSRAPVDCIVDLRDQLAAADIELLVLPVPPKTSAQGASLSGWTAEIDWLANPGAEAFYARLGEAGVGVLRVDELARTSGLGADFFMERDTHWTPAGLALVADALAERARGELDLAPRTLRAGATQAVSGRGDLVEMLRLPPGYEPFPPQTADLPMVPLRWTEFDRSSPLLLMGDSFTRVFSDPELGLGEGAGLGELLGQRLGLGVDRIAIAGGGALAVRETLARRAPLPPDEGGLAGKQLVVWQFSMRDLVGSAGLWTPVDLGPIEAAAAVESPADAVIEVRARLLEKSAVRDDFDYAFGLGIYEYEVLEVLAGELADATVWVAHEIVVERAATEAAGFEPGAELRLRLEDLGRHYDLEETSWVDETEAPIRARFWFPTEFERSN